MTDKELQELSNKVRMAIELEAPKARFITLFFTGEPEDKTLRCACASKCKTVDELAAINNLIDSVVEDKGVDRAKLLAAMITSGSATVSKNEF